MSYLGIDASLNSTGLCVQSADGEFSTRTILPKKLRSAERLDYNIRSLSSFLDRTPVRAAALEGYAMGIRGGRVFDIGEWGGLIRLELWRRNIPTIIVPPSTMKKYLCAGKLEKNQILLKVYKTYGVSCATDDEADALVLSDMAKHFCKKTKLLCERQKEALQKCSILVSLPKPIARIR